MPVIRVTKEFTFEMAHALWNYDGPCKNIHGHSYKLYVTVRGRTNEDTTSTKLGMVIDFSELKSIVKKFVVDYFDHSVIISSRSEQPDIKNVKEMFDKFYIVDYQPTCENMVVHMAGLIAGKLRGNIELYSLKLCETATSYAEWFASDNL